MASVELKSVREEAIRVETIRELRKVWIWSRRIQPTGKHTLIVKVLALLEKKSLRTAERPHVDDLVVCLLRQQL